ncbi:MAG TPA: DUF4169 family protein [Xanthobacteraceae bacterium]|jgi:hypothetical protein
MGLALLWTAEVRSYRLEACRLHHHVSATLSAHFARKQNDCNLHHRPFWLAGMGDVINLRQARKSRDRQVAQRKAAANRARHGRSKTERELDRSRAAEERRRLDRHLIEKGDEQ